MSFALMARLVHHSSHTANAPPVERIRHARHRHTTAPSVLIRAARGSDGDALERLAALDSARARRHAAGGRGRRRASSPRSPTTGAAIADPFLPTADVVALLELRAAGASAPHGRRRLAERLGLRPAPHARTA